MGKGKNKSRMHSNAYRREIANAPHPDEIGVIKSIWDREQKEKREAKLRNEAQNFDQEKREIELSEKNVVIDAETDLSDVEREVNIDDVQEELKKARRQFKECPLDFDIHGGWQPIPGVEFFPRYPCKNPFDSEMRNQMG